LAGDGPHTSIEIPGQVKMGDDIAVVENESTKNNIV
jgi:hypothetical protein